MKKVIFILFAVFMVYGAAAQQMDQMDKTFTGLLGQAQIVMRIVVQNGQVQGKYFDRSQGTDNDLNGTLDGKGNLSLNQLSNNGKRTVATFVGVLNGSVLTGTFQKADEKSTENFNLNASDQSYETIQNQILDDRFQKLSGYYEDKNDVYGYNIKNITLQYLSNWKFKFTLNIKGIESTCLDQFTGEGSFSKYGIGYFVYGTCELHFYFMPGDQMQINEQTCDNIHQTGCFIQGTYYKITPPSQKN